MRKVLVWAFWLVLMLLIQSVPAIWALQIERPQLDDINIGDRVENAATDGKASVGLGVVVNDYDERPGDESYDFIGLNVSLTANSRRGIEYSTADGIGWIPYDSLSYLQYHPAVGDEWGCWIDFPGSFDFRFYGGVESAEYRQVWVSSNGYICFDNSTLLSKSYPPSTWPSGESPDSVVAAVWTDLDVGNDGAIFAGLCQVGLFERYVVIWDNVRPKSNPDKRLTFEIALERKPPSSDTFPARQSYIEMTYRSVTGITATYASGIENQDGTMGCGAVVPGYTLGSISGQSFRYYQLSPFHTLKNLTLEFRDSSQCSEFNILQDPELVRGYHLELWNPDESEPDLNMRHLRTIGGTLTLLLPKFLESGIVEVPYAGLIVEMCAIGSYVLCGWNWYDMLAYKQYSNCRYTLFNNGVPGQPASINSPALAGVVDATLSIPVHWLLTDSHSQYHTLTVEARAFYDECQVSGQHVEKNVTTSVNVEVRPDGNNNELNTAEPIQPGICHDWRFINYQVDLNDAYKFQATTGQRIYARMNPQFPSYHDYSLYLYNPSKNLVQWSAHEGPQTEWVNFVANLTGDWYVKVNASSYSEGFYTLELSLGGTPLIPSRPSGPTGVSTFMYYTYSASTIDPDENFLMYEFDWDDGTTTQTSWTYSGMALTAYHNWRYKGPYEVKVRAKDTSGKWSNWSRSLHVDAADGGGSAGGSGCPILHTWNGSSYICEGLLSIHNADRMDVVTSRALASVPQRVGATYLFRLVEHAKTHSYIDQVKLYAIIEDQWLLPLPLVYAQHSEDGNALLPLLFSDDWRVSEAGAEHNNGTSQSIDLKFLALPQGITPTGFMFWIEGYNDEWK